jgi:hypothetical protein
VSSSPAEPFGEPVELVLIGRTLRGTLGEAFRRDAIAAFETRYATADAGGPGGADGGGPGGADGGGPGGADGGRPADVHGGRPGGADGGGAGDVDGGAAGDGHGGGPGGADGGGVGGVHGGGAGDADGGGLGTPVDRAAGGVAPRSAAVRPLRSSLSRTVELTAVALTRAGDVSVDVGIADPAFGSPSPRSRAGGERDELRDAGEQVFEVMVDEVDGISPIVGPPGVDLTRWAVVRVRPDDPGAPLAFRVTVVSPE